MEREKMYHTQIYFTQLQHKMIKEKSDLLGMKMSELIRRIIDKEFGIGEKNDK